MRKGVLTDGNIKPKVKVRIVYSELENAPLYVIMVRPLNDREFGRKELHLRCLVARSLFKNRTEVIGLATEHYEKGKGYSPDLLYNGTSTNFLHYFNLYNDFIINFEDLSLVYTNRKLFKDNNLIGYIDSFIDVFKGKNELTAVTSEKGTFTVTSTSFSNDCIFRFIEDHLTHNSDYSFLDDLGDEWADFIKLKNNSISLIHAKHGNSQLSASSFHDVVGQALKNIGNLNPSNIQLETTKAAKRSANYNIDTIAATINRLRHGDTIANAISIYKKLLITPNLKKEIILVLDFISRAQLKDRLQKLQAGTAFHEKNQVIQILWIISSLVNSCSENGIDIHIYCKP